VKFQKISAATIIVIVPILIMTLNAGRITYMERGNISSKLWEWKFLEFMMGFYIGSAQPVMEHGIAGKRVL
jgi:hypothetical protein